MTPQSEGRRLPSRQNPKASVETLGQVLERSNLAGRVAAAPLTAQDVITKKKKAQLKLTRSPKDMYDISRKVHGGGRLQETHYVGEAELEGQAYDHYERAGVQYFSSLRFLGTEDTPGTLIRRRPPKVSVSQSKNVLLLLNFTQQQHFNNEVKEPRARFNLREYAKGRGYTEAEFKRGGGFKDELKKDILDGAYTVFRIPNNEQGYILHSNFYSLKEYPANGELEIEWQSDYRNAVTNILNGNEKQFYQFSTEAISDRRLDEHPTLWHFYQALVHKTPRKGEQTIYKQVRKFLKEDLQLGEASLKRPLEAYKVLAKCLTYFHNNPLYPDTLAGITLEKGGQKVKLNDLSRFSPDANGLNQLVTAISGLEVRSYLDCNISFRVKPQSTQILPGGLPDIADINTIVGWVERWEANTSTPIRKYPTSEAKRAAVAKAISIAGADNVNYLFKKYAGAYEPNAFDFMVTELDKILYANRRPRF